jgi:tetratricopeptide (TPR) repeat protein
MRMSQSVLAVLATASLLVASSTAAASPILVAPNPLLAAKTLLTITSKSPEAVKSVETALELAANVRMTEAIAELNKALAADPDCALALALLGSLTMGNPAMEQLTKAENLSASLPEAEKQYIASLVAERRGDDKAATDALKAAAAAAPDDWRLQFALGQDAFGRFDDEAGTAAFKKATELNPTAGAPYNMLGYSFMRQNKPDAAIPAFTKYVELSPAEANAQDSLAEAFLAAGRLDEAEAGFRKALALQASSFPAWGGIAQVRFLKGDWTGGREALAKERDGATRDVDKADVDDALAWSYLAEGKTADALKTLDAMEKAAKEKSLDVIYVYAPLDRANFLVLSGDASKALPLIDEAMTRATAAKLPGGPMAAITQDCLRARIEACAKLGNAKDAEDAVTKLKAELAKSPANPGLVSELAFAQGAAAMAAKDYKAAAGKLATCIPADQFARLWHANALAANGDKAGAAAAAKDMLTVQHREPEWIWIAAQAKSIAPAQ